MKIVQKNIDPEEVLVMPNGDQYDLVSIINHIGSSLNSGHYITFVKKDGKWWTHNDDKPEKTISKRRLVSDDNYIYLYQKKTSLQLESSSKNSKVKKRKLDEDNSLTGLYDLSVCRGCNKTFKKLKNHLSKSETCRSHYNMEKLDQELKIKRRRNLTEIMKNANKNLKEEDKRRIQAESMKLNEIEKDLFIRYNMD
jgi:hypothetical protein